MSKLEARIFLAIVAGAVVFLAVAMNASNSVKQTGHIAVAGNGGGKGAGFD